MLPPTMHRRALALALILLLLLTQQLGLAHRASHGLAAAAEPLALALADADSRPAAADPAPMDSSPADAACQVCLLLAGLAFAALPALLHWRGLALRGTPLPALALLRCRAAASRPYQARAPPR